MSEDDNMSDCEEDLVDSKELDSQDLDEPENDASSGLYSINSILKYCYAVDHREDKVICFVSIILKLIGNQCKYCPLPAKATVRAIGCALVIKLKCEAGHVFSWASSLIITKRNGQAIYKINLVFASSLLLSGNNYYKRNQCCSFMGTKCISASTFFNYQRLYLCPVILKFFTTKMVSCDLPTIYFLVPCLLGLCVVRLQAVGCYSIW